jgi:hypothetical protein
VQLVDTTNMQPSVKREREANDGDHRRNDRNGAAQQLKILQRAAELRISS